MSDFFSSIILGIIQGLGEFLPISSSGHLVLAHSLFNLELSDKSLELAFDVALHFGTLLAVIWYFRHSLIKNTGKIFLDLKARLGQLGTGAKQKPLKTEERFLGLIVIATIPGALAGYFGEDLVQNYFRSPSSVAVTLIFYAVLLGIADQYFNKRQRKFNKAAGFNSLADLTFFQALIIGLAQALALAPGTSRSGVTITAALFLGFNRIQAARFSFMLSIPIIAGAALAKVPALFSADFNLTVLFSGFLASFLVGFLSIKYMLKYLTSKSYLVFVFYRIGLALLIFTVFS